MAFLERTVNGRRLVYLDSASSSQRPQAVLDAMDHYYEHNHANVLCLGSRLTGATVAVEALGAWLNATPAEGRHAARIAKLDELDEHLVDDER